MFLPQRALIEFIAVIAAIAVLLALTYQVIAPFLVALAWAGILVQVTVRSDIDTDIAHADPDLLIRQGATGVHAHACPCEDDGQDRASGYRSSPGHRARASISCTRMVPQSGPDDPLPATVRPPIWGGRPMTGRHTSRDQVVVDRREALKAALAGAAAAALAPGLFLVAIDSEARPPGEAASPVQRWGLLIDVS